MLSHLFNCHNEWTGVLVALGMLPFIGPWVRIKLCSLKDHFQDRTHGHDHTPHNH